MRRPRLGPAPRSAALAAVLLTLGTSCSSDPDPAEVEAVADEARGYVDAVVAELGRDPDLRQDVLTDCVPGRTDSGQELIYAVHVRTRGDKRELLRELSETWKGRGWTVEEMNAMDLRLSRGRFVVTLAVSARTGRAAVLGTGGCVE